MATYGWRTDRPVDEWLFAEGYRFDFYQATALLEGLHRRWRPDAAEAIGEEAEPEKEAVRFKSAVSLAFPATDVAEVTPPLLFRLGGQSQTGLDLGPLLRAFEDRNMPLSGDVIVYKIEERGDCWKIIDQHDPNRTYLVEKRPNQLNVYALPGRDERPAEMLVNFMGLAGGVGPLPLPDTESIIERVWNRDTAFRDFLDIFNHRLVSLMYRVRKLYRVGLELKPPDQTPIADYLLALIGLGTQGLRGRMVVVKDRTLLRYTGLLAQQPRSAVGLELLLRDYFKAGVKIVQFCGAWYPLAEDQWTYIGPSGHNQYLGMGSVLGTHVWDQGEKFELHLGPLTLTEFLDFLPGERGFRSLCELTRFYVGGGFDFEIRLTLKADEVPESHLSADADKGPRLGWTSWLKTRLFEEDDSQVRLLTFS